MAAAAALTFSFAFPGQRATMAMTIPIPHHMVVVVETAITALLKDLLILNQLLEAIPAICST